ncbi:MAG TPA: ATP-binding protein [Bryobacteraceae bacterium]|nr:ATP-binding protein [Bryobacteraceae bacterium]
MPYSNVDAAPADRSQDSRPLRGLRKAFGDLKVRPKLMILHNLFFLILAGAVFIAVHPPASRRLALLLALAAIYAGAVLALELVILPLYVYRPLRLMLDADAATQRGDHENELIPEGLIPGDEIGHIMRSRNATIASLRQHEKELAQALERLETARQNLADQDRLASLGLLSASVAHELNSPLAVLHGSVERLMETVPDEAAQQRLARMLRVSTRLRKISDTLLDFARPRPERTQTVCIRDVVEEAWDLLALEDKSSAVRFTNSVDSGELVTGNPDRLIQVLVNLLRNALLAAPGSGMIVVTARRFRDGGRDWVDLMVEDDGPGIPADVLPHVFEAFVTTRLDARGTGLGLAVAEAIVEQHGGTISAANRPGGGACLTVRLPAASAPARGAA